MAEALAIVGGVAAVLQLATSARKFAQVLYSFAADAGAAGTEVERFASQVQSFSDTTEMAQAGLYHYCVENPDTPVVTFIKSRGVLANIDIEARTVKRHLRTIQLRVKNLQSRSMLWASIKWSFKKSSILELGPGMESVKTGLSLALATAQLEAIIHVSRLGTNSEEIRRRIARQKRLIKTL
ncbi:hypothetical protein VTI74DRAFT_9021 [Chaetomium olivicolor]